MTATREIRLGLHRGLELFIVVGSDRVKVRLRQECRSGDWVTLSDGIVIPANKLRAVAALLGKLAIELAPGMMR